MAFDILNEFKVIKLIIKRTEKKNGNIAPKAYDILYNLPEMSLDYYKFPERHPMGIYNYSLSRILKSFIYIIKQIEIIENKQISKSSELTRSMDILLIIYSELLHALHAHIDDCFRILKIVSPYPTKEMNNLSSKKRNNVKRSAYKWLKEFNHPSYKNFEKNIAEYRNHIGSIVNKMKHNHARLRLISIDMEGFEVLGYYVEGIDVNKDNKIISCPDTKIHPNYTAFSFNRNLRFHFYYIYEISHYLQEALVFALEKEYNFKPTNFKPYINYNTDFDVVATKVQNLDIAFYFDEYEKSLPQILIKKNDNDIKLTLKLIDNKVQYNINGIRVNFFQEMDAVTEIVKRPYMDYFLNKGIKYNKIEFFDPK
jgi:hypothetical protein